jgi:hypothetical protein
MQLFMEMQRHAEERHTELVRSLTTARPPMHPAPSPPGLDGRGAVRVRAEVEWPSFDGKDVYYDIEDFLRDFRRVCMLCSGGRGLAAHERLEVLRGALKGTPLVDFRTFVDDVPARTTVLESGTMAEREALYNSVEAMLLTTHHRPLLERQRRAKAEYDAVSMRLDPTVDFVTFQAEFRKCLNNLVRAR